MNRVDFLVVGHVSRDLFETGSRLGGTAAYAGRTAQVLGCRTALVTSVGADYEISTMLPEIDLHFVESAETTSFENVYSAAGRRQTLHGRAACLEASDVPKDWLRAKMTLLAPLANEVDPAMIGAFSNSLVGLTPQGWLRRWDRHGCVFPSGWPEAERVLPLAAAVILSEEDLLDRAMLEAYRRWSRLLVLTQGAAGCTVFMGEQSRQIPAPKVQEREPTGAGDIFAAAYLIRLYQTGGNPWESARFANEVAALSVTEPDLDAKVACIGVMHSKQVR